MQEKNPNIRSYQEGDLPALMSIWLEENLSAHDFVSENYWLSHQADVAEALVNADLYIYLKNNEIVAFAGVVKGYLAGIFVDKNYHRQGIGQALLQELSSHYVEIVLDVYEKNQQAVKFYEKNNFKVIDKKIDETTQIVELTMKK